MWFDYQSLFDKIRNVVLEIDCNIEIKHTDFNCDNCAENATGIKNNSELLQSILSGSIDSVCEIVNNIFDYYTEESINDVFFDRDICIKNYCYLLAIAASLCDLDGKYDARDEVIKQIGFYPKEFLYS